MRVRARIGEVRTAEGAGLVKSDPEKRRRLKAYYQRCADLRQAYSLACDRWSPGNGARPVRGPFPAYPEDLRGLACGARTRRGTECKRTDLGVSGRCKFHGGMSTGQKTESGKAASRANLTKRWPVRTPCNADKC